MTTLAIWMLICFGVLVGIVRIAIQLARTGRTGLIAPRRGAGALGVVSVLLFNGGMALGVVSVIAVRHGSLQRIDALDVTVLHVIGIALAATGALAVFLAQLRMGDSWRVGVDERERTALVTGGWFAVCRNPIYSGLVVAVTGFALMVPTWVAFAAVVVAVAGVELQVRAVEEPYLLRAHGDVYRGYAARVGRFVPGVGRFRPTG